jgi:hypothetical protein
MADVLVRYRITDAISIDIRAASVLDAIQVLTDYSVLKHRQCGVCRSDNTSPNFKTAKNYEFYQHLCHDCGATLPMGQFKEREALFVKEAEGWSKYEKGQQSGGGQSGGGEHRQAPSRSEADDFF